MTIKQLKKVIENLPDEMKVVTGSCDHSYEEITSAKKLTALFCEQMGYYSEYDEELTPKEDWRDRVEVFFIDFY